MRNPKMIRTVSVKCMAAIMGAAAAMSPVTAAMGFAIEAQAVHYPEWRDAGGTVESGDTVGTNYGTISNNYGSVDVNRGTIENNAGGVVGTNYNNVTGGNVTNNYGTATNANIVDNYGKAVINIDGIEIGYNHTTGEVHNEGNGGVFIGTNDGVVFGNNMNIATNNNPGNLRPESVSVPPSTGNSGLKLSTAEIFGILNSLEQPSPSQPATASGSEGMGTLKILPDESPTLNQVENAFKDQLQSELSKIDNGTGSAASADQQMVKIDMGSNTLYTPGMLDALEKATDRDVAVSMALRDDKGHPVTMTVQGNSDYSAVDSYYDQTGSSAEGFRLVHSLIPEAEIAEASGSRNVNTANIYELKRKADEMVVGNWGERADTILGGRGVDRFYDVGHYFTDGGRDTDIDHAGDIVLSEQKVQTAATAAVAPAASTQVFNSNPTLNQHNGFFGD